MPAGRLSSFLVGGYQDLAIDLEGKIEVCDWLTPRGITCVLLKYRVTDVGPYPKSGPYPESPMALEDGAEDGGTGALARCGVGFPWKCICTPMADMRLGCGARSFR